MSVRGWWRLVWSGGRLPDPPRPVRVHIRYACGATEPVDPVYLGPVETDDGVVHEWTVPGVLLPGMTVHADVLPDHTDIVYDYYKE